MLSNTFFKTLAAKTPVKHRFVTVCFSVICLCAAKTLIAGGDEGPTGASKTMAAMHPTNTTPSTTPNTTPSTTASNQSAEQNQGQKMPPSKTESVTPKLAGFKAKYTISSSKVPFDGTIYRELTQKQSGEWLATSDAKAMFSQINQTSHFFLQDCRPQSQSFEYQRKVLGKKKNWSAQFNWQDKSLSYQPSKEQPRQLPIETQQLADPLSEEYVVRCLVASGQQQFSIPSFKKGEIRVNEYQVIGQEKLVTPLGEIKTVKVTKIHENPERNTDIWLWPEADYLLVQFEQLDEEEKLSIKITELNVSSQSQ